MLNYLLVAESLKLIKDGEIIKIPRSEIESQVISNLKLVNQYLNTD